MRLLSNLHVKGKPAVLPDRAIRRQSHYFIYRPRIYIYSIDGDGIVSLVCKFVTTITITNYTQQDATFLSLFIFTDAVHVSGGSSAHHQEHITVYTASGIVNQYCC